MIVIKCVYVFEVDRRQMTVKNFNGLWLIVLCMKFINVILAYILVYIRIFFLGNFISAKIDFFKIFFR